jgi:hypothetical protein
MTEQQREQNFNRFMVELTKISLKYGVSIQCTGGVDIFDPQDEPIFEGYKDIDYTSGDIEPDWGDLPF